MKVNCLKQMKKVGKGIEIFIYIVAIALVLFLIFLPSIKEYKNISKEDPEIIYEEITKPEVTTIDVSKETVSHKTYSLTSQEGCDAVKKYCFIKNEDLNNYTGKGYDVSFEYIGDSGNDFYIIEFTSYDNSHTNFYIDKYNGNVKIMDVDSSTGNEVKREETFNALDYIK